MNPPGLGSSRNSSLVLASFGWFHGRMVSRYFFVVAWMLWVASCDAERPEPERLAAAKQLLNEGQPEEALPLLRLTDGATPEAQFLLGKALLACGQASDAWTEFEPLLKETGGSRESEHPAQLRVEAARALRELDRSAEARDVLLPHLLEQPEDRQALHAMAAALRGLGGEDSRALAAAISRRNRELVPARLGTASAPGAPATRRGVR